MRFEIEQVTIVYHQRAEDKTEYTLPGIWDRDSHSLYFDPNSKPTLDQARLIGELLNRQTSTVELRNLNGATVAEGTWSVNKPGGGPFVQRPRV